MTRFFFQKNGKFSFNFPKMTMLSYERSFSIFIKGSKIITQDYQKLFLKVSFFQLRPMRDYQRKIGFLKLILALYASSLRKTRKWLKIEKKNDILKIKNGYLNFTIFFFVNKIDCSILQLNAIFMKIKISIFSEKRVFQKKKWFIMQMTTQLLELLR